MYGIDCANWILSLPKQQREKQLKMAKALVRARIYSTIVDALDLLYEKRNNRYLSQYQEPREAKVKY